MYRFIVFIMPFLDLPGTLLKVYKMGPESLDYTLSFFSAYFMEEVTMEDSSRAPLWGRIGGGSPIFCILPFLLVFSISLHSLKVVDVEDAGERKRYYTYSRTVEGLLQAAGIELQCGDGVEPDRGQLINCGDVISIQRSVTVGCGNSPDELLSPDMETEAESVNKEYVTEKEAIPYSTVKVNNPMLDRGTVRVKQEGEEGLREKVTEVLVRERKEISRTVVSTQVINPPQDRVVEYGTGNLLSRDGRTYQYEEVLTVNATAYCPGTPGSGCPIDGRGASRCTGFYNDGYTFSGARAVAGDGSRNNPHIIAVDPAVIPLQSLVYIEGFGFARAEDTGGAIKGLKIDVLFDRHADALDFGRRQVKLYLLEQ